MEVVLERTDSEKYYQTHTQLALERTALACLLQAT